MQNTEALFDFAAGSKHHKNMCVTLGWGESPQVPQQGTIPTACPEHHRLWGLTAWGRGRGWLAWAAPPEPACTGAPLPFFLFPFFFPLFSQSLADQLFNTFHPSSELPEVSCFKLNTFLFESTWVPGKFLALQMSSFEFLRCTWSLHLCFFLYFYYFKSHCSLFQVQSFPCSSAPCTDLSE